MAYKDLAKKKENARKYREKNREQLNEKKKKQYEKDKEKIKEYREENSDKYNEYQKEYREAKTRNAIDSITSGYIVDQRKWNLWCDKIKKNAEQKKHPYSDEFTNDVMFDMMIRGCCYCGDVATTIDRIDSALDHTPTNCVGCCGPCNISKGATALSMFIRKSYFKARGEYVDDVTDVWFSNKNKPNMMGYKRRAEKKKIPFELTEEKWKEMIVGECEYCHRKPTTYFGIDRVIPSLGYVINNVVTCCWDCNNDKNRYDVETTTARNERIAKRVDSRDLVL